MVGQQAKGLAISSHYSKLAGAMLLSSLVGDVKHPSVYAVNFEY